MYPISIIDNFFEDPDSVANLSKNLKYLPSADGTWPGVRSDNLHLIDWRLFDNVCRKISHIFYTPLLVFTKIRFALVQTLKHNHPQWQKTTMITYLRSLLLVTLVSESPTSSADS